MTKPMTEFNVQLKFPCQLFWIASVMLILIFINVLIFISGIIFRYHVKSTLTSPQEREICPIVSQTSFQNLDDVQELEKKDVTIVNMEPGGSIIFYIHCRTPEAAKLCLEMHQSNRLKELLSRIMNEPSPDHRWTSRDNRCQFRRGWSTEMWIFCENIK